MTRLKLYILAAFLLTSALQVQSADKRYFNSGAIGIQYGVWKPTSLESNPGSFWNRIEGSGYAPGVFAISPSWSGISLRVQAFQWEINNPQTEMVGEKLAIRYFAAEIKQQIISIAPISPYATFGLAQVYCRYKYNLQTLLVLLFQLWY